MLDGSGTAVIFTGAAKPMMFPGVLMAPKLVAAPVVKIDRSQFESVEYCVRYTGHARYVESSFWK